MMLKSLLKRAAKARICGACGGKNQLVKVYAVVEVAKVDKDRGWFSSGGVYDASDCPLCGRQTVHGKRYPKLEDERERDENNEKQHAD